MCYCFLSQYFDCADPTIWTLQAPASKDLIPVSGITLRPTGSFGSARAYRTSASLFPVTIAITGASTPAMLSFISRPYRQRGDRKEVSDRDKLHTLRLVYTIPFWPGDTESASELLPVKSMAYSRDLRYGGHCCVCTSGAFCVDCGENKVISLLRPTVHTE